MRLIVFLVILVIGIVGGNMLSAWRYGPAAADVALEGIEGCVPPGVRTKIWDIQIRTAKTQHQEGEKTAIALGADIAENIAKRDANDKKIHALNEAIEPLGDSHSWVRIGGTKYTRADLEGERRTLHADNKVLRDKEARLRDAQSKLRAILATNAARISKLEADFTAATTSIEGASDESANPALEAAERTGKALTRDARSATRTSSSTSITPAADSLALYQPQ